jgi:hypothetical protein
VNSVEEGPFITLLNQHARCGLYHVDKKTGKIIWQIGESKVILLWAKRELPGSRARYRPKKQISCLGRACCASSSSPLRARLAA